MGRVGVFSFYPGKNLGACGEAGAVTTDDESIARYCQMLRDHGQSMKYIHDIEGYNGRLDAMQAGFLAVKLQHLAEWNAQRRERARVYDELFGHAGGVGPCAPRTVLVATGLPPLRRAGRGPGWTPKGPGCRRHRDRHSLPDPLHLAKPYEALGFRRGDFPASEHAASHILSLPMFPELSREQQERVVAAVVQSVASGAPMAGTKAGGPG